MIQDLSLLGKLLMEGYVIEYLILMTLVQEVLIDAQEVIMKVLVKLKENMLMIINLLFFI